MTETTERDPESRTCPHCGRPSAPNARPSDHRCGPCHNFGVEGVGPDGTLLVRAFDWLKNTRRDCEAAGTYDQAYRRWLQALEEQVHRRDRRESGRQSVT
jgi:hypothetical protein